MDEEREQKKDSEDEKKISAEGLLGMSRKNPWVISTVILGIILILLLAFGGITGNAVSEKTAGDWIVQFAESRGVQANIVSVNDMGSLYAVILMIDGQQVPVYVTKDGKYMVQAPQPLIVQPSGGQEQQQGTDVPKSGKPIVELFVMTHCPYGAQAEKGIIPVLELFGDKIEGDVRFVHYFMHGDKEQQETYSQLCIREEQSGKYLDYLACFLEDGDSQRCLAKTKIDKTKLNSCISLNAEQYYADDSALSQQYGVKGSPTLIINGAIVNSGRSSAEYLDAVCSAFNSSPDECKEALSSTAQGPGFGYNTGSAPTSSGSAGSCG